MANVSRTMASYPSPSLDWGRNLSQEGVKSLPNAGSLSKLKRYLETQLKYGNVAGGKMLKLASKDIILNEDTINAFFDKLAVAMESTTTSTSSLPGAIKKPKNISFKDTSGNLPGINQFAGSPVIKGSMEKHTKISPIQGQSAMNRTNQNNELSMNPEQNNGGYSQ